MRFIHSTFYLFIVFYSSYSLATAQIAKLVDSPINMPKNLDIDNLNVSGIAFPYGFMALATDEGNALQILSLDEKHTWQNHSVVILSNNTDELDIEALAWQEPYLYALGSHSAKRKKLKTNQTQKDNAKRLSETSLEPARQQLFRIELDSTAQVKSIDVLSLENALKANLILAPFINLPSKENGIDLEGLAIDDKGRLLVGLRGPVLRGNIASVLRVKLAKKGFSVKSTKHLFLPSIGTGVRGISEMTPIKSLLKPAAQFASAKDQYLVLMGAVGDQPLPYQVSLWNGKNALPGKNTNTYFTKLCELPNLPGLQKGKAEGIQFIRQTDNIIEFLVVFDGLENGQPTVFECTLK